MIGYRKKERISRWRRAVRRAKGIADRLRTAWHVVRGHLTIFRVEVWLPETLRVVVPRNTKLYVGQCILMVGTMVEIGPEGERVRIGPARTIGEGS